MYFEEQGQGFRCPQCSGPRRRYAKKVGDRVGTTLDGKECNTLSRAHAYSVHSGDGGSDSSWNMADIFFISYTFADDTLSLSHTPGLIHFLGPFHNVKQVVMLPFFCFPLEVSSRPLPLVSGPSTTCKRRYLGTKCEYRPYRVISCRTVPFHSSRAKAAITVRYSKVQVDSNYCQCWSIADLMRCSLQFVVVM